MGMNAGFAAYLANKKANKGATAPSPMAGMMMSSTVKGAPKGKRHSKVKVSMAHKKGK